MVNLVTEYTVENGEYYHGYCFRGDSGVAYKALGLTMYDNSLGTNDIVSVVIPTDEDFDPHMENTQ